MSFWIIQLHVSRLPITSNRLPRYKFQFSNCSPQRSCLKTTSFYCHWLRADKLSFPTYKNSKKHYLVTFYSREDGPLDKFDHLPKFIRLKVKVRIWIQSKKLQNIFIISYHIILRISNRIYIIIYYTSSYFTLNTISVIWRLRK